MVTSPASPGVLALVLLLLGGCQLADVSSRSGPSSERTDTSWSALVPAAVQQGLSPQGTATVANAVEVALVERDSVITPVLWRDRVAGVTGTVGVSDAPPGVGTEACARLTFTVSTRDDPATVTACRTPGSDTWRPV